MIATPERSTLVRLRLAAATFAILALELTLIRWMGGQIRIFAYFANLVLLAAFLGMGLGLQLGRRRPELVRWALPALVPLAAALAFSPQLGLVHLRFPDSSISLWGAEGPTTILGLLRGTGLVLALFWAVTLVFVLLAAPVGSYFEQLPPLQAYSADLLGSLLGVLAMTAVAALSTSPVVWLLLAVVPTLWLAPKPLTVAAAAAILVLGWVSIRGALFSPYNRLDVGRSSPEQGGNWVVFQNRDYSQDIYDLSPGAKTSGLDVAFLRAVYELPFAQEAPGSRALIVGAGTGNDAAAAVRRGFRDVVAVEIDPKIVELGKLLHPERPYFAAGVHPVINDARAYFEQNRNEKFDVVCYGLLDSHAMFSSMSSLRLENYVYTVEGLRAGWEHVRDGGTLSVSFSVGGHPFVASRILGALEEATGKVPVVVRHWMNLGVTFLVSKGTEPVRVPDELRHALVSPIRDETIRIPRDDWPFLYLKPRAFPTTYLVVLGAIVLSAWWAIRRVYGRALSSGQFDVALFLMGAAFLLLETRTVTALSLVFGSTWIVNASVFAGILATAFLANTFVAGRIIRRPMLWYLPLCASLVATWAIEPGLLNRLSLLERGAVAGLLYAVPVAFAGVLFSTFLRNAVNPASALGSNLLGAVMGGVLEYSSMFFGLRNLILLALVLYLGSYLASSRSGRFQPVSREAGQA